MTSHLLEAVIMEFGISLASEVDSWKWVRRAEELGFTHAWFNDSQLLDADLFVSMTLAAANTEKIRLGTSVLVPSNRIAPVTANVTEVEISEMQLARKRRSGRIRASVAFTRSPLCRGKPAGGPGSGSGRAGGEAPR